MGLFFVPILVRNWQNRFLPPEQRGEDVSFEALVDSCAVELCLPAEQIEQLRLVELGTITGETADGGHHDYRVMGMAEVEVQGRTTRVRAIELPRGARPLLGAVLLEEMDWHIPPKEQRLLPNPRNPEGPVVLLM
jgi:clan AA aspartic protease